MKLLRETIRKLILENIGTQFATMKEHPLWIALSAQGSRAQASHHQGVVFIDHPEGCTSEVYLSLDEEEHPGGIWVDNLYVMNTETRELDPECFRKGYAKELLALLTQAADQTGTHLTLIAAFEPYLARKYPSFELPDKDQLAKLYSQFGFVETERNFAQIYMKRDPK